MYSGSGINTIDHLEGLKGKPFVSRPCSLADRYHLPPDQCPGSTPLSLMTDASLPYHLSEHQSEGLHPHV